MILKKQFLVVWILVGLILFNLPLILVLQPKPLYVLHYGMSVLAVLSNYHLLNFFDQKFHGKNLWETNPVGQFKYLLLGETALSILLFTVAYFLATAVSPTSYDFNRYIYISLFSLLLTNFILGFLKISFLLISKNKFLRKERKSFRQLSNITQKKSLQDLVSPHFLFNSLNTAASIIPEDTEQAKSFLNKLSDLYDFILKNNENQLIALTEELEIVEKYSYLIQTRFGNAFQISIDIPEQYNQVLIPPLALQNLVENAAKHNAVTRKKNLLLTIKIVEDNIVVENNLNPKTTFSKESTNLGLNYIQAQIEQFSQKPVIIDKSETHFRVEIPLIYPTTVGVS